MKKKFILFISLLIFGIVVFVGLTIYIKSEDKIVYTIVSETGDRSLLKGLCLETFVRGTTDYWDDQTTDWKAKTTFENGILTESAKHRHDGEADLLRNEVINEKLRFRTETYAIDVKDYYEFFNGNVKKNDDTLILVAVDEKGENRITISDIRHTGDGSYSINGIAVSGDDCFFVWYKNVIYRMGTEVNPENAEFTYSIVGNYDYNVSDLLLSNDLKYVYAVFEKEDKMYIEQLDAKTGKKLADVYLWDGKKEDRLISSLWNDDRYLYVECLGSSYSASDSNHASKILVLDVENELEICDGFDGVVSWSLSPDYAYDKETHRLAVFSLRQDSEALRLYVDIEVFDNKMENKYSGEYECNILREYDYYSYNYAEWNINY